LPGRIFMVSSLVPEHVVNLVTLVPDQDTCGSTFIDRTPPLRPNSMHQVLLIGFMIHLIF
jgi:hypothetical protein